MMFNCIKVSINLINIILRSFKEFLFFSNWSLHSILFARKDKSCRAFGKCEKCTYVHTHTCISRDVQTHIFIHICKHTQSYTLLTWNFICILLSNHFCLVSSPTQIFFHFFLPNVYLSIRTGRLSTVWFQQIVFLCAHYSLSRAAMTQVRW